jgi:hypothetical protein
MTTLVALEQLMFILGVLDQSWALNLKQLSAQLEMLVIGFLPQVIKPQLILIKQ